MPVKIVPPNESPKSERKSEKRFEKTRMWKLVKADLDKGYPNEKGIIVLELTPAEMDEMSIQSDRTIVRFIAAYLKENNLTHRVKVRRRDGLSRVIIEAGPKSVGPAKRTVR